MDPGSAAHRKSAAQHPGNAFLILTSGVFAHLEPWGHSSCAMLGADQKRLALSRQPRKIRQHRLDQIAVLRIGRT
jgi:hypothetical protein